MSKDIDDVRKLILLYQDALNAGIVEDIACVRLLHPFNLSAPLPPNSQKFVAPRGLCPPDKDILGLPIIRLFEYELTCMLNRSLFVSNGVVMHQHYPVSVGVDTICRSYERILSERKLESKIDIKEIVPIGPNWAFARMESKEGGDSTQRRDVGEVANQTLLVFQKVKVGEQRGDGEGEVWEWRLARTCSSNITALPK